MPKTLLTTRFSAFATLHNILHKDVEQEYLSEASMPFATPVFYSVLSKKTLTVVASLSGSQHLRDLEKDTYC